MIVWVERRLAFGGIHKAISIVAESVDRGAIFTPCADRLFDVIWGDFTVCKGCFRIPTLSCIGFFTVFGGQKFWRGESWVFVPGRVVELRDAAEVEAVVDGADGSCEAVGVVGVGVACA